MLVAKKEPLELVDGMLVEYEIKGKETYAGLGRVVGIATTGTAVIGRSIILKDLSGNFPNSVYPFECFCCFECWLKQASTADSH